MSVFTTDWPNSTETMAERALRYGDPAEPGTVYTGWFYDLTQYADRSALLSLRNGLPAMVFPNWDHGDC